MSSVKPLREVVQQLGNTFSDPRNRESSYFNFYDDSLIIHGFPPNLPANIWLGGSARTIMPKLTALKR
jgi:hypothetical protein